MDNMLYHEVQLCSDNSEWIVLVHGLGGSLETWQLQLRSFKKRYNLLLIDMPGHGNSIIPVEKMPKAITDAMFVESTTEVMDLLGIESAHFMSISLGSSVILALVHGAPDRMISAVFGGGIGYVRGIWRLLFQVTLFLGRHAPWLFSRKLLYRFIAWAILPRKAQAAGGKKYTELALKVPIQTFWAWMENIAYHLDDESLQMFAEDFNREGIPSLWISGSNDYVCRPGVEQYVNELDDAEYHLSEGVGHLVNIEGATKFNRRVLSWLDGLSG